MDPQPLDAFTLIVPFYRSCRMLERQIAEWKLYPDKGVSIIVVDDGSPEPAVDVLHAMGNAELFERVRLYRITVDIPWNREGARNLGAREAATRWIVHVDIDHVLPADAVKSLLGMRLSERSWFRFPRWRCGAADETRKKDKIPPLQRYGQIHPHVDSYLVTRDAYWSIGGYDEDYSGVLGGGSPFLRRLEAALGPPPTLPLPVRLEVHTRDSVPDASVSTLSRDTSAGKALERDKRAGGRVVPKDHLRFPWLRVAL